MTEIVHYAVLFALPAQTIYTLWYSDDDGDRFATGSDGSLIWTDSLSKLNELAKRDNISLTDSSDVQTLSCQMLHSAVCNMQPEMPLTTSDSSTILEWWNALDDLANTFGLSHEEIGPDEKLLYDKIFLGNNLDSITPPGNTYHPIFLENEQYLLRTKINDKLGKISGPAPMFADFSLS